MSSIISRVGARHLMVAASPRTLAATLHTSAPSAVIEKWFGDGGVMARPSLRGNWMNAHNYKKGDREETIQWLGNENYLR